MYEQRRSKAGTLSASARGLFELQRAAGNQAAIAQVQRGRGVKIAEHEKGSARSKGAEPTGHAIERHVGKDWRFLEDRLEAQTNLVLATSFYDEAHADRAVDFCRRMNQKAIARFVAARGGADKQAFTVRVKAPVGLGARRAGKEIEKVNALYGVKIVVKREGGGKWHILTAFPTA